MNHGHIVVDYPYILSQGICGMRKIVNAHPAKGSPAFWQVLDAFSLFIRLYGESASKL